MWIQDPSASGSNTFETRLVDRVPKLGKWLGGDAESFTLNPRIAHVVEPGSGCGPVAVAYTPCLAEKVVSREFDHLKVCGFPLPVEVDSCVGKRGVPAETDDDEIGVPEFSIGLEIGSSRRGRNRPSGFDSGKLV